jgi:hypothetical protein
MVRPHARAASCAFALAVALALAACSAIVDFKGLAGPRSGDAGDAGADARAADGATAEDSGATSGSDGGDEAGVFVCPDGGFCDDFDTPPLGATWSSMTVDGKAGLFLFDGGSISAPFSLQVAVAMQAPGPTRHAELEKNLPSPGQGVRCTVSTRIDSAPPSGDATLLTIRPTSAEVKENEIYITYNAASGIGNEDYKFGDGGGDSINDMFAAFPTGRWFRLGFETDYKTANIFVDGVMTGSIALGPQFTPTSLQVALGERYDTERGPSLVLFDNYACVVTP